MAYGDLLERHGVLALHGARLSEGAPGVLGADLRARIAADQARNAAHALVLEHVLDEVHAVLARADIAHVALKGPRLARAAHGDPALRASADLDVLVDRSDLRRAVEVLTAAGFGTPPDRLDSAGLPDLHLTLTHPEPWGPPLELHWRVHWADTGHAETLLRMDSAGGPERDAGQLVSLLLCYARDGFVGVRLASDIAGWWEGHGAALDHVAIEPFARSHPSLLPVLATATAVAELVCGVPAHRLLGDAARAEARGRAVRMADPVADRGSGQLRAQQVAIDLLLTPPGGRTAFVRRQVRNGLSLDRRRDRLAHLPKVIAQVARALARQAGPTP